MVNERLEQEGSPFRFLNGELAPITNEQELDEIRAATAEDANKSFGFLESFRCRHFLSGLPL
jgi:hypothetical protein